MKLDHFLVEPVMRLALIATVAVLSFAASQAMAGSATVTVDGQSGPWNQPANPGMTYGFNDNLDPTSVSAGFNFTAGGDFTITYLSGLTSAYGSTDPYSDAGGDTTYEADDGGGSSGNGFPSFYTPTQYPAYLNELIGAFADSSGAVVGGAFVIGNGPFHVLAPGGATQLLLGLNDDIFNDNSGSLRVLVTGPGGVPEPASWALMIAGFGLAGAALRRRRTVAVAA